MATLERRRASRLNVEPRSGILAVGHKTTLLDPIPPTVERIVASYMDLVLSQRAEMPSSVDALRDDELAVLAIKLDLPASQVELLVAREFERRLAPPEEPPAPAKRGFLKRLRS